MDTTNSNESDDTDVPLEESIEESMGDKKTADSNASTPMDMELPDCITQESSTHIYTSSSLITQAFVKMKSLRDTNMLCDVVLVVGAKRISAHRLVLASTFDYFSSMFTQVCLVFRASYQNLGKSTFT